MFIFLIITIKKTVQQNCQRVPTKLFPTPRQPENFECIATYCESYITLVNLPGKEKQDGNFRVSANKLEMCNELNDKDKFFQEVKGTFFCCYVCVRNKSTAG